MLIDNVAKSRMEQVLAVAATGDMAAAVLLYKELFPLALTTRISEAALADLVALAQMIGLAR